MARHVFEFPYAELIFGKNFSMVCTAYFEYEESESRYDITFLELTGVDESGTIIDMSWLGDDEDKTPFVVQHIYLNKQHWDKTEGDHWWGQERRN